MSAPVVPFPRVCADCPHDECIELVKAWRLLTDDIERHSKEYA